MTLETARRAAPGRLRALAVAAAAAAALCGLPASAHADVLTLGSDLTGPANLVEAHGADSVFYNTSIDGRPQAVPAGGQVLFVRVKGVVVDSPDRPRNPNPEFHVQVLHPTTGDRVKVMLSSAPFFLPIVRGEQGTNTQQVSGFKPINLCVQKGDWVDFNDIGGFQYSWGGLQGMHFLIFSRTPDSFLNFYTKDNGTKNGSEWAPQQTKQGEELLMQVKLGVGADATSRCPGGYKNHIFHGVGIRRETVDVSPRKRTLKLHAKCPSKSYGGCKGVAVVKATLGGQETTIGGAAFSIKPAWTNNLVVTVSRKVLRKIKNAGGVKATVTASAHDSPPADARKQGVPVQRKTTTGTVKIRPTG